MSRFIISFLLLFIISLNSPSFAQNLEEQRQQMILKLQKFIREYKQDSSLFYTTPIENKVFLPQIQETDSAVVKEINLLNDYESRIRYFFSKDDSISQRGYTFGLSRYTWASGNLINKFLRKKNYTAVDIFVSHLYRFSEECCFDLYDYASLSRYIADYYQILQNWTEASKIYKKLLELSSPDKYDYVQLQNNLAILYIEIGKYDEAITLLDSAYQVLSTKWTIYPDNKFLTRCNKALAMRLKGNPGISISLCEAVIDSINERNSRPSNNKFYNAINKIDIPQSIAYKYANIELARSYIDRELYDSAYICISRLDTITSFTGGSTYDNYLQTACKCGIHIDSKTSVHRLSQYDKYLIEEIIKKTISFSEIERESYWESKSKLMDFLHNHSAYLYKDSANISMAYNNLLFTKNLRQNSRNIVRTVVHGSDSLLLEKYYKLQKDSEQAIYGQTNQQQKDSLKNLIIKTDKDITQNISGLSDILMSRIIKWEDIRTVLDSKDIAIEFIRYYKDNRYHYGAFYLTHDSPFPKFIEIEDVETIDNYLSKDLSPNELYSSSNGNFFYDHIWEKLIPSTKDKNNIYISCTGSLNRINFNAIPDSSNSHLGDKYNIILLSSTAKILESKQNCKPNLNSATLYGGLYYETNYETMVEEASKYKDLPHLYRGLTSDSIYSSLRKGVSYLDGTMEETNKIYKILKKKGCSVDLKQKYKGNEESFKHLSSKAPSIIHLATHGFYLSTQQDIAQNSFANKLTSFSNNNRSMLYSGLLLSGAAKAWRGKLNRETEDGILTADEISRINLDNTEIAILSACQSGLGNIDETEGVLGLPRGFKNAGVNTIIMSLWDVPDESTQFLMVYFYKYLTKGYSPHMSLKKATIKVRNKYPEPENWAGFILLDGN